MKDKGKQVITGDVDGGSALDWLNVATIGANCRVWIQRCSK